MDLSTVISRGDTGFGEIPGYRKYQDSNGLTVLEVPILGEESDVLANLPTIGDAHPDYPDLKCVEAPETGEPGGGISSKIVYKGGAATEDGIILGAGYSTPRKTGNSSEKSIQVNGLVHWKYKALKTGNFETTFTVKYRGDTVTYYYGGTAWFSTAKFASLAAVDISSDPQILSRAPSEPYSLLLQKNVPIYWRECRNPADTTIHYYYYLFPDGTAKTGIGDDATTYLGYETVQEKLYYGELDYIDLSESITFRRIYSLQKDQQAPALFSYNESWELEGEIPSV